MTDTEFILIAKALADPTRRQMLDRLRSQVEMTCSCMCGSFSLTQPTISHHVKTLEAAGLILVRREGQFHKLTVNDAKLREFARQVAPESPKIAPPRAKRAAGAARKSSV